MFASPLRVAAVIAATLLCLAPFTTRALANAKVCRNLEQRYEQIEREADSIEINATLFSAADKGCEDLARRLLDKGASLEARDRLGAEPLARAAVAGERELVALFLDKGAPIDARNIEGSTALFQAAEQGRPPVVRLLIERGANISHLIPEAPMFSHRAAVHPRLERLFGEARVKRQVKVAKSRLVIGRGQLAGRVIADGLQEPVSRAAIDARFDLEHRLICQLLQAITHICRR
jgi:hypothetical protein